MQQLAWILDNRPTRSLDGENGTQIHVAHNGWCGPLILSQSQGARMYASISRQGSLPWQHSSYIKL